METRICTKCNIEKPLDNIFFIASDSKKIYFGHMCRSCRYAQRNEKRQLSKKPVVPKPIPTSRKCSKCKEVKPLTSEYFYKDADRKVIGLSYWCKECDKAAARGRFKKEDPFVLKAKRSAKKLQTKIRKNNKINLTRFEIKLKVLTHYSNGELKCACPNCNVDIYEFLTLNHTGEFKKFQNGSPRGGKDLFKWLIKNNFPPGLNVLCMNCNWAMGKRKQCPHQNIVFAKGATA